MQTSILHRQFPPYFCVENLLKTFILNSFISFILKKGLSVEIVKVKHLQWTKEKHASQNSLNEILPFKVYVWHEGVCSIKDFFVIFSGASQHNTLYCFFLNCKNASWTLQCQWNVIKLYIYLLLFTLNKNEMLPPARSENIVSEYKPLNTSFLFISIWINEDLGQNITNRGPICPPCVSSK